MSNYDELVKALLSASTVSTAWGKMMQDAAAAIENLTGFLAEAERDRDEYRERLDKMWDNAQSDTVCHCQVKENAELIAKILDDDVDGKAYEPKRGEWNKKTVAFYWKCSNCGVCVQEQNTYIGPFLDRGELNYCPNCGAKMEVQDG